MSIGDGATYLETGRQTFSCCALYTWLKVSEYLKGRVHHCQDKQLVIKEKTFLLPFILSPNVEQIKQIKQRMR